MRLAPRGLPPSHRILADRHHIVNAKVRTVKSQKGSDPLNFRGEGEKGTFIFFAGEPER